MNALALDPASKTGWAWTNGSVTKSGVWVLNQHHRLSDLYDKIMDVNNHWGPLEAIAYEDASFGAINRNTQAMHNELRGVTRLVGERLNIPTVPFHPTTVKSLTGSGRANKLDMKLACKRLLGIDPRTDDEADALFVMEAYKQKQQRDRIAAAATPHTAERLF